ncbi:hypothetical protein NMY22_g16773 [Coprinellus aureogranulatus]|nr:hypothetical protein NMY22_g16773 [Coprinellus aureogranulatus]
MALQRLVGIFAQSDRGVGFLRAFSFILSDLFFISHTLFCILHIPLFICRIVQVTVPSGRAWTCLKVPRSWKSKWIARSVIELHEYQTGVLNLAHWRGVLEGANADGSVYRLTKSMWNILAGQYDKRLGVDRRVPVVGVHIRVADLKLKLFSSRYELFLVPLDRENLKWREDSISTVSEVTVMISFKSALRLAAGMQDRPGRPSDCIRNLLVHEGKLDHMERCWLLFHGVIDFLEAASQSLADYFTTRSLGGNNFLSSLI